jgi:glutamate synthase (ferredoxin)
VAIACLLGAEEFGFATAPLVASGCVMMRACHLNTCPVGIATQDPELRKNFKGTPEHVINFMHFVAEELRQIMAQLGFRTLKEMVGQSQKINAKPAVEHYKAKGVDISTILHQPEMEKTSALSNSESQDHKLENVLDIQILNTVKSAIINKKKTTLNYNIQNTDRTLGAIISNEISKLHGEDGLPEDTLNLNFKGSAGQSFGAFTTKGITLKVNGETNDYLGKGLSGAKIIIKKPDEATFNAQDNIIIGNVCFYGAVNGEAYINGIAGERFAVRNSGITAVVEGVGDHGCEYMTGGKVIILGETGRNFAAGMSGGIAYIYDKKKNFESELCNLEMVDLDPLSTDDFNDLKEQIEKHLNYTNSALAKELLNNWDDAKKDFIKVFPKDYKKALQRIAEDNINKLTA